MILTIVITLSRADYNEDYVSYISELSASYCFRESPYINFLTVVLTALYPS